MNWLKLLALLREIPLGELLNYPKDITDSIACRGWVYAVLDSLVLFADLTDMELDDEVLGVITSFIDNDDVWNLAHGVFVDVFTDSRVTSFSERAWVRVDGVKAHGFNPVFVTIIIQFVLLVLRCIKRPVK